MTIERSTTVLLAANALISGCLLWVHLSGVAPMVSSVDAAPQYQSSRGARQAPSQDELVGVAGASSRQRKQIVDQLKVISTKLDGLDKSLQSGTIAVQVGNLDEVELSIDYDRLARAIERGNQ